MATDVFFKKFFFSYDGKMIFFLLVDSGSGQLLKALIF